MVEFKENNGMKSMIGQIMIKIEMMQKNWVNKGENRYKKLIDDENWEKKIVKTKCISK